MLRCAAGNLQQQAAAAQQPSQEIPIDYNAQAAVQKQGESQMAAQQGGYPGAEADMTAAEAVAAALNMSADGSALGLPAHVDHLGQVCIQCPIDIPLFLWWQQKCTHSSQKCDCGVFGAACKA